MVTVVLIDLIVVAVLWFTARRKGLAEALPYFAFFSIIVPDQSQFKVPGFDLTTRRLAVIVLLILYVMAKKRRERAGVPLKSLMLVAVGWTLVSTLCSLSVSTSFKQLIAQVIEYYLVYYIFVRVISRPQTIDKIASAVVLAMGVCCLFGVLEAYAHWSVVSLFPADLWQKYSAGNSPIYMSDDRGLRVQSTFPHPILFGDAIAMSFPIALYLLSSGKHGCSKKLVWFVLLLMLWNVYKTGSRGAWLASAIAFSLLFLLLRNKARTYILTLAALGILAVAVRPGVWESMYNMYLETQDPTNPLGMSYDYRYALMDSVEKAAQQSPARYLFGHGLGTFRELGLVVEFRDTQHNTSYRWFTCDSSWILFLYELGYGGLLIMAMLLFKPVWIALRGYLRLRAPDKYLSAALLTALIAYYFSMLSVSAYVWGQAGLMVWLFISMIVSYDRVKRSEAFARLASRSSTSGMPQIAQMEGVGA